MQNQTEISHVEKHPYPLNVQNNFIADVKSIIEQGKKQAVSCVSLAKNDISDHKICSVAKNTLLLRPIWGWIWCGGINKFN